MILVFVGAGGSASVNSDQYPTTQVFFDNKLKDIRTMDLFIRMKGLIEEKKKTVDIEDMLGALNELQEKGKKAIDPTDILGAALKKRLGIIEGVSSGSLTSSMNLLLHNAHSLAYKIHRRVHDVYSEPPSHDQLDNWIRLLSGLATIDPNIEIFTTNYDRVLETLIRKLDLDIATGRIQDHDQTILNLSFWQNAPKPRGLLTKLHGSADWQRDRDGGIYISKVDTEDDNKQAILYPGHKGEPTKDPFKLFHRYFQTVIKSKTLYAAVFVGFAFRDQYINDLLSELPKHIPGVFFTLDNPKRDPTHDPPQRAPILDYCLHFPSGLTDKNALLCFQGFVDGALGERMEAARRMASS